MPRAWPQPKATTMKFSNDPAAVTALYVPGFVANMALSPQQTKTRLLDAVDSDMSYTEPGEGFNLDDVGETDPEDVAVRVPNTPDKFIGEERRVANFTEFHDSAWFDNVDQTKLLEDPTNIKMAALMAGRWRKVDDKIIQAGLGNAYKKNPADGGLTPVSLPATQIVAANSVKRAHDSEAVPTDNSDYGMSIGKLIEANALLDESEIEGDRYVILTSDEIASLLQRTPTTSQDYAAVHALHSGSVDHLLGFKVKRLSKKRVPIIGTNRRLMAWVKPAIAYRGRPINNSNASIHIRHDKSNTPQAFYKTSHAAGRRYDEGVVEIQAKI